MSNIEQLKANLEMARITTASARLSLSAALSRKIERESPEYQAIWTHWLACVDNEAEAKRAYLDARSKVRLFD